MRLLIVLFMLVTTIGCTFNQNNFTPQEKLLYDLNNKYDSIREFFEDKMINHFPRTIDSNTISFTESLSPDFGDIELIYTAKTTDLSLELKKIGRSPIAIYNADDTCLLIVNKYATSANYYKLKSPDNESNIKSLGCYKDKYPVPNFWHNDYTVEDTQCKLPDDFKLYVLEANAGIYLNKKYLTDGKFMPDNWKNGYSKGVAISEKRKVIIYWVIIW